MNEAGFFGLVYSTSTGTIIFGREVTLCFYSVGSWTDVCVTQDAFAGVPMHLLPIYVTQKKLFSTTCLRQLCVCQCEL